MGMAVTDTAICGRPEFGPLVSTYRKTIQSFEPAHIFFACGALTACTGNKKTPVW
jgi:hypothetical protein